MSLRTVPGAGSITNLRDCAVLASDGWPGTPAVCNGGGQIQDQLGFSMSLHAFPRKLGRTAARPSPHPARPFAVRAAIQRVRAREGCGAGALCRTLIFTRVHPLLSRWSHTVQFWAYLRSLLLCPPSQKIFLPSDVVIRARIAQWIVTGSLRCTPLQVFVSP